MEKDKVLTRQRGLLSLRGPVMASNIMIARERVRHTHDSGFPPRQTLPQAVIAGCPNDAFYNHRLKLCYPTHDYSELPGGWQSSSGQEGFERTSVT